MVDELSGHRGVGIMFDNNGQAIRQNSSKSNKFLGTFARHSIIAISGWRLMEKRLKMIHGIIL